MPDAPLILGVSGLRGIVGESLTPMVATRFAATFGRWLAQRAGRDARVLLARDGRAGGEPIYRAACAGLHASGCTVSGLGVAMTPTAGVMADREGADGAVIVTASHNPQQWNGLKLLTRESAWAGGGPGIDACAPSAEIAAEIVGAYETATHDAGYAGATPSTDLAGAGPHSALVAGAIEQLLGIPSLWDCVGAGVHAPIVVDSVNASSVEPDRVFFGAGPCELIQVAGDASGIFPHPPEPTRENLSGEGGLCDAVVKHRAAIGFAQDPDADRLAIVDETGRYIGEEYTLALCAASLLDALAASGRGAADRVLCTNLSTSRMIDDVAARYGARVVRTPVGEANVVESMRCADALLGGEGNGGVILPDVTYVRDSLSAMALVLVFMSRTKKTIGELVAEMPSYAIEKRKTALASKADAEPAVASVARAYADHGVDLQDGVRVDFRDRQAWVHVRASNTEPIMRLIAEAPSVDEACSILDEVERVIR